MGRGNCGYDIIYEKIIIVVVVELLWLCALVSSKNKVTQKRLKGRNSNCLWGRSVLGHIVLPFLRWWPSRSIPKQLQVLGDTSSLEGQQGPLLEYLYVFSPVIVQIPAPRSVSVTLSPGDLMFSSRLMGTPTHMTFIHVHTRMYT